MSITASNDLNEETLDALNKQVIIWIKGAVKQLCFFFWNVYEGSTCTTKKFKLVAMFEISLEVMLIFDIRLLSFPLVLSFNLCIFVMIRASIHTYRKENQIFSESDTLLDELFSCAGSWGWCFWDWNLSGYMLCSSCFRLCVQTCWDK